MAVTIETLRLRIRADLSELNKATSTFTGIIRDWGNSVNRLGQELRYAGFMGSAAMAPVTLMARNAIKDFMEWEKELRNINSLMLENEQTVQQMGNVLNQLSIETAFDPTQTLGGMYHVISATFRGAEAFQVMEAAALGARAGIGSIDTSAKMVSQVLQAYGEEASASMDVIDTLFLTVKRGITTWEQLNRHMGVAVASAAAANVSFHELMAAMATMTRGGIDVHAAYTALNRLTIRVTQGNVKLDKVFKKLGFTSMYEAVRVKGFGWAIMVLGKYTKGSARELMRLGFAFRDLKAVLSLTRLGGEAFMSDLALFLNASTRTGSAMEAFEEQTRSLDFQVTQLKSAWKVFRIELGRSIAPYLRKPLKMMFNLVYAMRLMTEEQKIFVMKIAAIAIAIPAVALGLGLFIKLIGSTAVALGVIIPLIVGAVAGWKTMAWAVKSLANMKIEFFEQLASDIEKFQSGMKDIKARDIPEFIAMFITLGTYIKYGIQTLLGFQKAWFKFVRDSVLILDIKRLKAFGDFLHNMQIWIGYGMSNSIRQVAKLGRALLDFGKDLMRFDEMAHAIASQEEKPWRQSYVYAAKMFQFIGRRIKNIDRWKNLVSDIGGMFPWRTPPGDKVHMGLREILEDFGKRVLFRPVNHLQRWWKKAVKEWGGLEEANEKRVVAFFEAYKKGLITYKEMLQKIFNLTSKALGDQRKNIEQMMMALSQNRLKSMPEWGTPEAARMMSRIQHEGIGLEMGLREIEIQKKQEELLGKIAENTAKMTMGSALGFLTGYGPGPAPGAGGFIQGVVLGPFSGGGS